MLGARGWLLPALLVPPDQQRLPTCHGIGGASSPFTGDSVRCSPTMRLHSDAFAVVECATVPPGSDDSLLPDVLRTLWPHRFTSQSSSRKACRRSLVLVDGVVGRSALKVAAGCTLSVVQRVAAPSPGAGRRGRADAQALRVIYEDDSLAVVYKPAGIAVQGGNASQSQQMPLRALLANSLQPSRDAADQPLWRPQHVHRLDRPTSGLLVVAKTGQALRTLSAGFKDRLVHKRYRAVVAGHLNAPKGRTKLIDTPLSGQSAKTYWRVVRRATSDLFGEVSLLDLFPYTGRTHQLRRHMVSIGHPIVGDAKYWPSSLPQDNTRGLLLSAVELELPHPKTGILLRVRTAQPGSFDDIVGYGVSRFS
ncbi:hypothetical protein AB1Y20_010199 [Prymnesium parvum]|uniref:Pseudouridine synthase RsuA/RluA-like domain-containing protein n=1 Tax=Prymnesium parvum TaxID=97485 RepID=A0AB34K3S3_PRYPA